MKTIHMATTFPLHVFSNVSTSSSYREEAPLKYCQATLNIKQNSKASKEKDMR